MLRVDVLTIDVGDEVVVTFDSANERWRQGVWLGTEGLLRVGDYTGAQVVLWRDAAPRAVPLEVLGTDGLLRLYNVWDSGRGLGPYESQSATSGMLVEEVSGGRRSYRCNDIGLDPQFDSVVFTIEVRQRRRMKGPAHRPSDREQRQLDLMLDRISQFRRQELTIKQAVNDLEALLYELEESEEAWRDAYLEHWGVLEVSFALALDRGLPMPTAEDWAIAEAWGAMEQLIYGAPGQRDAPPQIPRTGIDRDR